MEDRTNIDSSGSGALSGWRRDRQDQDLSDQLADSGTLRGGKPTEREAGPISGHAPPQHHPNQRPKGSKGPHDEAETRQRSQ